MANPLLVTDLVLRDASQSLLATRVRIEDMLPICDKLDQKPGAARPLTRVFATSAKIRGNGCGN